MEGVFNARPLREMEGKWREGHYLPRAGLLFSNTPHLFPPEATDALRE